MPKSMLHPEASPCRNVISEQLPDLDCRNEKLRSQFWESIRLQYGTRSMIQVNPYLHASKHLDESSKGWNLSVLSVKIRITPCELNIERLTSKDAVNI